MRFITKLLTGTALACVAIDLVLREREVVVLATKALHREMKLRRTALLPLTKEELALLEKILRAPYNNEGHCPFCLASGTPEPDNDWHEEHCVTHWARRVRDADEGMRSYAEVLEEYRAMKGHCIGGLRCEKTEGCIMAFQHDPPCKVEEVKACEICGRMPWEPCVARVHDPAYQAFVKQQGGT